LCKAVLVMEQQQSLAAQTSLFALSKNQHRKQENYIRTCARKKAGRKAEQLAARARWREARRAGGPGKVELRAEQLERLSLAREGGVRVCVDCRYEDLMSDKELNHLANQLKRVYSSNKAASSPVHLSFISLPANSRTYQLCCQKNAGFENYAVTVEAAGAGLLFSAEEVVYLCPDSDNVLENISRDKVYIIGGLVDDSVKKDTSREFSLEARLTTARLPIPEWMVRREGGSYKQILTINQVFDILLDFHHTGDWSTALTRHVPAKCGWIPRPESASDSEDAGLEETGT